MARDDVYFLPERGGAPDLPGTYQVTIKLSSAQGEGPLGLITDALSARFEKVALAADAILSSFGGPVLTFSIPEAIPKDFALGFLNALPGIELAELDSVATVQLASADPLLTGGVLWGMENAPSSPFGSQATEAWANAQVSADGRVGDMSTVVGVIDSGIDPLHPDLYLNIWINNNEIPDGLAFDSDGDGVITFRDLNERDAGGAYLHAVTDINGSGFIDADDILQDAAWADGLDQDGNGYLDDLFGWDFFGNDNRPFESYEGSTDTSVDKEPSDSYHGTHVAGTIGANENDQGVVGVSWDVQLMPLRFIGASGSGWTSDAVSALNYYADLGQDHLDLNFVGTNNSWGGGSPSTSLENAIEAAGNLGHLFVAAAGNDTADNDLVGSYPANYEVLSTFEGNVFDPIISVASLDDDGGLSSFSNWGAATVDLGAPGGTIASTFAGDEYFNEYTYVYSSGTSMATPHVTGALALLSSEFGDYSPQLLKEILLTRTTATTSLDGITTTGGRLDVAAMVEQSVGISSSVAPSIYIESKPVAFGQVHLYLVYRDELGNEWVTRSSSDGSSIFGGPMAFQINVPIELSADARGNLTPAERNSTELDLGGYSADEAWAIMVRYARVFAENGYSYQVFGTNSNAFVGAMLEGIGLDPYTNLPTTIDTGDAVGITSHDDMVADFAPPPNGDLLGTTAMDTILGIQIDEFIYGLGDNDTIFGGDGNDHIEGGAGDDAVDGENGDDTLIDDAGSDAYVGGAGMDTVRFALAQSAYAFEQGASGELRVGDGTDTDSVDATVEFLEFFGETIAFGDLYAAAGLEITVVGGLTFNEASAYATFTVTGNPGEAVELALGATATGTDVDATTAGFGLEYSTDGGGSWTLYTWDGASGDQPTVPAGGSILVRVGIGAEADDTFEGAETFELTASYSSNGTVNDAALATIVDDGTGHRDENGDGDNLDGGLEDGPFDDDRPALAVDDVTVNEGAGTLGFTVTRVGATTLAATVDYALNDGSAVAGTDYTDDADTLTFAAGETEKTVSVAILNDSPAVFEGPESFTIDLANATNATIADDQGVATILDDGTGAGGIDDDRPALAVNDVTVNEGAGVLDFTVTRTGNTALAATVDFTLNDGSAAAGTDYTDAADTLSFAVGETEKTVSVTILNDSPATFEGPESFTIDLANATNATIADDQGVATILDDGTGAGGTDDDRPALAVNDVTVNEGAGVLDFTVTRTGNTTLAATVDYALNDGSAAAGTDYTDAADTLSFAVGETEKTVSVIILTDSPAVLEGTETFTIDLANATNAVIVDAQGVGTILGNPDLVAGNVAVSNTAPTVGDTITVTYDITNAGDGAAIDTTAGIYLSTDGVITAEDTLLGSELSTESTGAGAVDSEAVSVLLPELAAGTYYVGVIADDLDSETAESDETNNASPAPVEISLMPDLFINVVRQDDDPHVSFNGIREDTGSRGFDLAGAIVTATYTDGLTETLTWQALDAFTNGGAVGADIDMFFGWSEHQLTTTKRLASFEIDLQPSSSVWDTTAADEDQDPLAASTPGSSFGFPFDFVSGAEPLAGNVTVTYAGVVNLAGRPADGDLYTTMLVDFSGLEDGGFLGYVEWNSDIDTMEVAGDLVAHEESPALAVNDVTVNEGAGTLDFTVTRTGNTALVATVGHALNDGSAVAGSDYTDAADTLSFGVGETEKTVSVAILNDDPAVFEGPESFTIDLSNANNATIADAQGVGTIFDDGNGFGGSNDDRVINVAGGLAFNEASHYVTFVVTAEAGYFVELVLENTPTDLDSDATISEFVVEYSTNGGSSWTTYTWDGVTGDRPFSPAGGSIPVRVDITSETDYEYEGAENFHLSASYTSNKSVSDTNIATIVDDGTGRRDENGDGDTIDGGGEDGPFDDDRKDFMLALGVPEVGSFGNLFNGASDPDGLIRAAFTGTAEDLVLSFTGYDVDFVDEVEVLLNGLSLGYLERTPNRETAPYQFEILADAQQAGDNIIEFRASDPIYSWGITDIVIEPGALTDFTLALGVLETGSYGNLFNGSFDQDGLIRAAFTGTAEDLVLSFTGYDVDFVDEVEVLLNGLSLGYLERTPNRETAPYQFEISADAQQAGDNIIEFRASDPIYSWGITDIVIEPGALTDFTLALGVLETGSYGNLFNGSFDQDGLIRAAFTGTAEDLVLSFTGYDVDFVDEVEVLLNGLSLGYLERTPNRETAPYQFEISADAQQAGDNIIEFRASDPIYSWGITDIVIEPGALTDFTLALGVLETGSYGNLFNGSFDQDGLIRAAFTGTAEDLVLSFTGYDVDFVDEVEVLLNGLSLGYLERTPNRETAPYQFEILADAQQAGDNIIEFRASDPIYSWGITDLLIDEIAFL